MRMNMQRDFLLFVVLAAATPALAQTATPAVVPAGSAAHGAASVPTFPTCGVIRASWFEPPHRVRPGDQPVARGPAASWRLRLARIEPAQGRVSNYDQLVGDYTNPILQPWAAQVVKGFGEISLAGVTYPNPSNQCCPARALHLQAQSDAGDSAAGTDHVRVCRGS